MIYDMIYLLTTVALTHGGSNTVHIYTQTIHRTTQLTTRWWWWWCVTRNDPCSDPNLTSSYSLSLPNFRGYYNSLWLKEYYVCLAARWTVILN